MFMPLSTGITYAVIDKVAQDKIPLVTIGYGRTDASDGRVFPWVFPLLTKHVLHTDRVFMNRANILGQLLTGTTVSTARP